MTPAIKLGQLHAIENLIDTSIASKDFEEATALNNLIPSTILGWATSPADPKRLWRNSQGDIIVVKVDDSEFKVCQHPWRPGINADDEISFSFAFNYHPKIIDWRKWTKGLLHT